MLRVTSDPDGPALAPVRSRVRNRVVQGNAVVLGLAFVTDQDVSAVATVSRLMFSDSALWEKRRQDQRRGPGTVIGVLWFFGLAIRTAVRSIPFLVRVGAAQGACTGGRRPRAGLRSARLQPFPRASNPRSSRSADHAARAQITGVTPIGMAGRGRRPGHRRRGAGTADPLPGAEPSPPPASAVPPSRAGQLRTHSRPGSAADIPATLSRTAGEPAGRRATACTGAGERAGPVAAGGLSAAGCSGHGSADGAERPSRARPEQPSRGPAGSRRDSDIRLPLVPVEGTSGLRLSGERVAAASP